MVDQYIFFSPYNNGSSEYTFEHYFDYKTLP